MVTSKTETELIERLNRVKKLYDNALTSEQFRDARKWKLKIDSLYWILSMYSNPK